MATILDIIDRFEVPPEYHDALWEAYQEGAKRGFIDGTLTGTDMELKAVSQHGVNSKPQGRLKR